MANAVLTYENVEVSYSGNPVTHGVSFELHEGEILGLVGESGSGKSALMRAAMGLLGDAGAVTAGAIRYRGPQGDVNLLELSARELRSLCGPDLGMIFQDCLASFSPIHPIINQIRAALAAHDMPTDDVHERAVELMTKLRIKDPERVLAGYPFQLSGGMGQRVGIAVALLMRPKVLLADEPTSALDVVSQKQVIEELAMLRREFGTSVILVTHNMGVVRALADSALVLRLGDVVEQGSADEVLNHPREDYTRELIAAAPMLRHVS